MKKINKEAVIRARATLPEKYDVQWAANFERLDEADIVRKACSWYVAKLKASMPQQHSHAA